MNEMNFHASTPILRVRSLDESLRYYNDLLGFATDWSFEGVMASVSRGAASIMLSENDQGQFGSWVYIGVGDVVRLHEEMVSKGAVIKLPPSNFSWAMEIHVSDPDGNVIRFGSDPDRSRPFDDWVAWYANP